MPEARHLPVRGQGASARLYHRRGVHSRDQAVSRARSWASSAPINSGATNPPVLDLLFSRFCGHYDLGIARPVPENVLGRAGREQRPHLGGEVVKTMTKQVLAPRIRGTSSRQDALAISQQVGDARDEELPRNTKAVRTSTSSKRWCRSGAMPWVAAHYPAPLDMYCAAARMLSSGRERHRCSRPRQPRYNCPAGELSEQSRRRPRG